MDEKDQRNDKTQLGPRRSLDSVSSTRSDAGTADPEVPPPVLAKNKEDGDADADIDHDEIEATVPGHEFDVELGRVMQPPLSYAFPDD